MSKNRVSEAVARPARTGVQATPAFLLVWLVDENIWNMNDETFTVMTILVTMLFSFIQTAIENLKGKAFLRNIPPASAPITDTDETQTPGANEAGL